MDERAMGELDQLRATWWAAEAAYRQSFNAPRGEPTRPGDFKDAADAAREAYYAAVGETDTRIALLEQDNTKLEAENERLRSALARWGQHDRGCALTFTMGREACDCGCSAALERARA